MGQANMEVRSLGANICAPMRQHREKYNGGRAPACLCAPLERRPATRKKRIGLSKESVPDVFGVVQLINKRFYYVSAHNSSASISRLPIHARVLAVRRVGRHLQRQDVPMVHRR